MSPAKNNANFFIDLNKDDKENDRHFYLRESGFLFLKSLLMFHGYKYRQNKSKTQEQKEILVKPLLQTLLWFYTLNPTTIDPYSLKPFFNDLLDKGLCIVV